MSSPGRTSLMEVWILRCEIAWLVSPLGRISLTVVWISRDEIVSSPGRMSLTEVWIHEMKSQSKQQRVLQNRKEHVRRSKTNCRCVTYWMPEKAVQTAWE